MKIAALLFIPALLLIGLIFAEDLEERKERSAMLVDVCREFGGYPERDSYGWYQGCKLPESL